jgi:hypothetical protein
MDLVLTFEVEMNTPTREVNKVQLSIMNLDYALCSTVIALLVVVSLYAVRD